MRALLALALVGLVICPSMQLVSQSQNASPGPPTFDFHWTSGNMLELVTTTASTQELRVKICEYPFSNEPENIKFSKPATLRISPVSWFPRSNSPAILIYKKGDKLSQFRAHSGVVFPDSALSAIICDTTCDDFPVDQRFYAMGWNGKRFCKLVVSSGNLKDTLSRLTIERKIRNASVISLLEDETDTSISNKDLARVNLSLDTTSLANGFLVSLGRTTAQSADTVSMRTILPEEAGFEVDAEGPDKSYLETPWVRVNAGPKGEVTPFYLPPGFRLIDNAGRVRVKYLQSGADKQTDEQQQDVIVLERHKLAMEAGPVFSINGNGTPIGKLEYSIFAESLWKKWLIGEAAARFTSMRGPSIFDTTKKTQEVNIEPVVEGELTLRANPWWTSDFDPRAFSFIGGIFMRTSPTPDSSDLRLYVGWGLGIGLAVPAYNERRAAKDFGHAAGFLSLMILRDPFWVNAPWRLRMGIRIDFLKLGADAVTISLKGRLDSPIGHLQPTDLRFGIASTIDAGTISGLLK